MGVGSLGSGLMGGKLETIFARACSAGPSTEQGVDEKELTVPKVTAAKLGTIFARARHEVVFSYARSEQNLKMPS